MGSSGRRSPLQPSGPCARCTNSALKPISVRETPVARCAECDGILVARRDLAALLEVLARELIETVDVERPVPPVPDEGGGLSCPSCAAVMEHFGYMGGRQVMIDGCDPCGFLWLDSEELSAVSLLFARTELRRDAHRREVEARTRTYVDDARAVIREAQERVRSVFLGCARLDSLDVR